jgi:hypothetical protein
MGKGCLDPLAEIASVKFVHGCSCSQMRNCHYRNGETSANAGRETLFSANANLETCPCQRL